VKLFLDTSAFAKRYVAEPGSDKVLKLCRSAERLAVSVICLPEIVSTLNRLVRERELSAAKYQTLKIRLLSDLGDADICGITTQVLGSVIQLLESKALRAADAIHVACAMAYRADTFASADRRQLAADRKARLRVVDVS
jgi:predicted nucleic acid-binding protein